MRYQILFSIALIVGLIIFGSIPKSKLDLTSESRTPVRQPQSETPKTIDRVDGFKPNLHHKKKMPHLDRAPKVSQSLEDFFQSLDPNSRWKFSRDSDNRVFSMSGGYIHGFGQSPEMALPLARQMASALELKPNQLQVDEQFQFGGKNPMSDVFNYQQVVSGYEVYQAYLRLFTRTSDQAIYFVNNELKDPGTPDLVIHISSGQAAVVMREAYPDRNLQIEKAEQKPLLFVEKPGQSELVWKTVVRLPRPLSDRREILVSARTGKIVQNRSLVVY